MKAQDDGRGSRPAVEEAKVVLDNANRNLELQRSIMEAVVADARAKLDRMEKLSDAHIISESQVESARSRLKILDTVWPKRAKPAKGDATKSTQ